MEEGAGIHQVGEVRDVSLGEEACLEPAQGVVVRWVEWEGGLILVLRTECQD